MDRRLRVIEAPGFGIVGRSVELRVAVDDLGVPASGAGGAARLSIRRDGAPPRIESVPVGREHRIEIPIERGGPTVVELAAEARPGEVSDLNNRAVVTITGVRDRLRVLLVSGEPHAGERTWRRLLKADPGVDLVHFTILRPPEKDDLTPLNELALIAFPVRELFQVKLREFDLVVFDRFANRGILPPRLSPEHRRLRPRRRRAADVGRAGIRRPGQPGRDAARRRAAGPARAGAGSSGAAEGAFRPMVTALGARHPVTEGLTGANPDEQHEAELGPLVPQHAGRPAQRHRGDGAAPAARRCWCSTAWARAASPCCCPTISGSGRAAMTAAGRRPSCCAAPRIG